MSVVWRSRQEATASTSAPSTPVAATPVAATPVPGKGRRHSRLWSVLVVAGLVGAPLGAVGGMAGLARADSGSSLAGSPFNGGDGVLDTTPASTVITVLDHTGSAEEGYTGGAKENDLCPNITLHAPSPKNDITSFSVGSKHVSGANPGDFLYLAWTRATNNGTTTIEFELNQSTAPCAPAKPTRSNRVRTNNDLRIIYNFHGGTVDSIKESKWVAATNSWSSPITLNSTVQEAEISTNQLFGEVVINLDLLPQFFDPAVCTTLSSAFARSRSSSGSDDSELKDFVPPAFTTISNCGSIEVKKTDDTGAGLAGAVFGLFTDAAATVPATTPAQAGNNQCTTSGGNASTPASCSFANVHPGTYYVKELSAPSHFSTDSTITPVTAVIGQSVTVSHTFVNPRNPGDIRVNKVDDTGAGVNGALFGLFSDAAATTPATTATNNQCTTAGGGPATAATCTFDDVTPDSYFVKEISAPGHFTADQTIAPVTAVSDVTTTVSHVFVNPRNGGSVKVLKTDDLGDGVAGALFGLFSDAAATTPATTATNNQCTTSGGGAATAAACTFDGATPGSYFVKEITAPTHYAADQTIAAVTVVSDTETTVSHTFVNPRNPGTLIVAKNDDAGAGLDGAVFGLYSDPGATTLATTATNNQCTTSGGAVGTPATCLFTGVLPGTYYVKEISAPAGYAVDSAVVTVTATSDTRTTVAHTFVDSKLPIGLDVAKTVNGQHSSTASPLIVENGAALDYVVVVTNTGQLPLTITQLDDTRNATLAATCDHGIGFVLAPAQKITCTYQTTASADQDNVATAQGTDSFGRTATGTDAVAVNVIHPGISLTKSASPTTVNSGDTVTYTYVVTNTGDVALTNVSVTDDVLGTIGTVASLAPGASTTLTKAVVVTASTPATNTGTASGVDPLGNTVSATSHATITRVLGLQITAPAPTVAPATLPRTGAPVDREARTGVALLLVGMLFVVSARRRREARQPTG